MTLKIDKINARYCLLIFPFLVPSSLYVYPEILSIIKLLKLTVFGYSMLLLLRKRVKMNNSILCPVVLFVWMLLTTIIQLGDVYKWFSDVYPYFTVTVLVNAWYQRKSESTVKVIANFFIIFLFLNVMTWLAGGMYVDTTSSFGTERIVYFWGIRNSLTYCLLPIGMVVYLSLKTQQHSKFFELLGYAALILNIYIAFDLEIVTTIFALIVFFVIYFLNNSHYRKLPKWNKVIVSLILGMAILVTGFGLSNKIFDGLFTELGKGTTFNGRTIIWTSVLSQIKGMEWLLGHGTGSKKSFVLRGLYTSTTHSQYLFILYDSGLIGLVLFVWMICAPLKRLFEIKTRFESKIIFAGITSILAAGIVENLCNNCYFYTMYALVFCIVQERVTEYQIQETMMTV